MKAIFGSGGSRRASWVRRGGGTDTSRAPSGGVGASDGVGTSKHIGARLEAATASAARRWWRRGATHGAHAAAALPDVGDGHAAPKSLDGLTNVVQNDPTVGSLDLTDPRHCRGHPIRDSSAQVQALTERVRLRKPSLASCAIEELFRHECVACGKAVTARVAVVRGGRPTTQCPHITPRQRHSVVGCAALDPSPFHVGRLCLGQLASLFRPARSTSRIIHPASPSQEARIVGQVAQLVRARGRSEITQNPAGCACVLSYCATVEDHVRSSHLRLAI